MTVQQAHRPELEERLRVLKGRKRGRRPSMAPWVIMVLIAVVAFLGLGFASTSLDKSAFELAELNRAIDSELAINQQLKLEVARLENPARIAPLAHEMGLVLPIETTQLLVDLDVQQPVVADAAGDGANQ